jgi:hypothetical protein
MHAVSHRTKPSMDVYAANAALDKACEEVVQPAHAPALLDSPLVAVWGILGAVQRQVFIGRSNPANAVHHNISILISPQRR